MLWSRSKKHDGGEAADTRMPYLQTERLYLRPAIHSDYAQWSLVRRRNYSYLKPFEPRWPEDCLTESFFRRRIVRLEQDRIEDRSCSFLIFRAADKILVGGININNISRGAAQFASLGYWLAEDEQGKGYMTESGEAVLYHAFGSLGLMRMNAATLPHNARSRAMLERIGFTEEGFAKEYIQIDGERRDHVLYGLNAADFLAQQDLGAP